jgi:hypothetical protein
MIGGTFSNLVLFNHAYDQARAGAVIITNDDCGGRPFTDDSIPKSGRNYLMQADQIATRLLEVWFETEASTAYCLAAKIRNG